MAAAVTDPAELTEAVLAAGRDAGLDAIGVTTAAPFAGTRAVLEERRAAGLHGGMAFTYRDPARSCDPARALPGARSVVVAARGYLRTPPGRDGEPGAPTRPHPDRVEDRVEGRVARYAWSDDYGALRAGLTEVAEHLRAAGHRSVVLVDDNALVDRAAAVRAGLGWYGKNSLVLLPGRGSWYVLGSVVTDAVLAPTDVAVAPPARGSDGARIALSPSPTPGGCGTCTRCLPACPTGALVAPGVLDARRCLAWLVQAPGIIPIAFREAIGDRLYGCDDCQDACPVNRTAARRADPPEADAGADTTVDVLELLESTDEAILARYGRWYIAKRDPVHLRRSALVVVANAAPLRHPRALAAVRRALHAPEAVLRAHAVWAAGRLGIGAEAAALADDPDPDVRAEVAALPTVVDRTRAG